MDFEYEYKNGQVHLYDHTGTECSSSPVSHSGAREIPADIVSMLTQEMQNEFQANGFSDRFLNMIRVIVGRTEFLEER